MESIKKACKYNLDQLVKEVAVKNGITVYVNSFRFLFITNYVKIAIENQFDIKLEIEVIGTSRFKYKIYPYFECETVVVIHDLNFFELILQELDIAFIKEEDNRLNNNSNNDGTLFITYTLRVPKLTQKVKKAYKPDIHPLLSGWYNKYQNHEGCDIEIKSLDGSSFWVHEHIVKIQNNAYLTNQISGKFVNRHISFNYDRDTVDYYVKYLYLGFFAFYDGNEFDFTELLDLANYICDHNLFNMIVKVINGINKYYPLLIQYSEIQKDNLVFQDYIKSSLFFRCESVYRENYAKKRIMSMLKSQHIRGMISFKLTNYANNIYYIDLALLLNFQGQFPTRTEMKIELRHESQYDDFILSYTTDYDPLLSREIFFVVGTVITVRDEKFIIEKQRSY